MFLDRTLLSCQQAMLLKREESLEDAQSITHGQSHFINSPFAVDRDKKAQFETISGNACESEL